MANETTNVVVIKEVIIYARFIGHQNKVKTTFTGMIGVADGCAATITMTWESSRNFFEKHHLDLYHKIVAFGSDVVSLMINREMVYQLS